MLEVKYSMGQSMCKREGSVKIPSRFRITKYEKTLISKQLVRAVENLKEVRREIAEAVIEIMEMKEAGDPFADQAVTAIDEAFSSASIPLSVYSSRRKNAKKEATKQLYLFRSYE